MANGRSAGMAVRALALSTLVDLIFTEAAYGRRTKAGGN